jgi:hypothetical protein
MDKRIIYPNYGAFLLFFLRDLSCFRWSKYHEVTNTLFSGIIS